MEKIVNEKNIEQWRGMADIYHDARPAIPGEIITKIILLLFRKEPDTVVDVGSGTGRSTIIWENIVPNIIGIEPNDDMRTTAEKNTNSDRIVFKKGVSNETNLSSDCADIITISQAFHWVDINSSLVEFYRVLKKDGILAIYDFELSPVIDWEIEKAYLDLTAKCSEIYYSQKNPASRNDKSTYHDKIKSFGKFRYSKEVTCHSVEKFTPQRLLEFALETSNALFVMKIDATIKKDIDDFYDLVKAKYSGEFEVIFSYKILLAIK